MNWCRYGILTLARGKIQPLSHHARHLQPLFNMSHLKQQVMTLDGGHVPDTQTWTEFPYCRFGRTRTNYWNLFENETVYGSSVSGFPSPSNNASFVSKSTLLGRSEAREDHWLPLNLK